MGQSRPRKRDKIDNLKKLFKSSRELLSSEGNSQEKFKYLIKKARDNSVMIIHPKNLNDHQLCFIEAQLKKNNIRFISINQYLSSIKKEHL